MSSPRFERVKAEHKGLSDLLDRMATYVHHQLTSQEEYVTPKLAAASLGVSEGEAFVLLKIMTAAGILQQQYNVYCRKQDMLIESVDSLDALDNIDDCDYCDAKHKPSQLYAEIAFRPAKGIGAADLAA